MGFGWEWIHWAESGTSSTRPTIARDVKKRFKGPIFYPISIGWWYFSKNCYSNYFQSSLEDFEAKFFGWKEDTVKLQALRREFETLGMKAKEPVQAYLSRVSSIVSQMKSYGETVSDHVIVSKVLRSLTAEFNHVVVAIEESKDLSTYSFDELMDSLLAHEVRINRPYEKVEERPFRWRRSVTRSSLKTQPLEIRAEEATMFMDMVMDEDDAHFLQRATSSVATARNLAYRIRGTKQKNEQKHANLT